jgi:uncharacterized membrane protein
VIASFAGFWMGGDLGRAGSLVLTASDAWMVGTGVVALIVLALAQWGRRPLVARLAESALLSGALAATWFALAGPVWVEESGRTEPGRIVVLVDGSRSMGVLEGGAARSDVVPGLLDAIRADVGEHEVYRFGDELEVGAPDAFDLPGTDLGGALDALSERMAGERLAAVVVVTDGIDRGLLRRSFENDPQAGAPDVPGPLSVYQVGERRSVVDLSVRAIDAGGYAFIRAPFTITADLLGVGFAGRTVTATLSRDGGTVTSKEVTLDADGKGRVAFEVVPEDAGRFAYAVTVPSYEGDAVPANDTMPVVVTVVRDRVRVLQVAGAPSWDVKFLRRFLKDDPSVQLVSFFILRTEEDLNAQYGERELSLIQFPYERLFSEDLSTFDVVIFQNFDYEPYFRSAWGNGGDLLDNVRRYVDDGGAFVMVGGDRSFQLGKYGGTPIAELLPVELGTGKEVPDLRAFAPRLTPEGARHPVTRLVPDGAENETWWGRLRALDGTNLPLRARPDAAVLLTHPTLTDADGAPLPVLSVREVGAGRTMALTVDTSWRWSLSEAAVGRGNQAYLRFWKNALRWLMKDAAVSRVTVETPRENYAVGEEVRVVVRARDPGFAPLAGARVVATVDNEGRETSLEGRTSADGDLALVVPADHPGTHRVRAVVTAGEQGAEVGSAETVFAVTTRDPEMDEIAPDEAFLQWLASGTGGRWHPPGERGPVLRDPSAERTVLERAETPLWRAPLLGLIVATLAGAAWIVRRRSGLK